MLLTLLLLLLLLTVTATLYCGRRISLNILHAVVTSFPLRDDYNTGYSN